jgi:sugar fermentation stimulation protein A
MNMKMVGELVEGQLIARDNRFRVTVQLDERQVWAHLPNPGRLGELLVPQRRVILARRPGGQRKTGYDLCLVEMDGRWVSVDARLPNRLVAEALATGRLAPLAGYPTVRREVSFGRSRLDFLLEAPDRRPCLVEVKSVTLVVDGLGCFPDAVTLRGRRHVQELAAAIAAGYRAVVVFVVQREDALGLRPYHESDPSFAQALHDAVGRGVEVYAYACHVEPGHVEISHQLPIRLEESA